MATTTFDALKAALARTNVGYETNITETDVANTDYAVLMDDNNQIKLALITDLIGDGDITVGIDGTGYDVQFFGDTSGSYMLWDQSEDTLSLVASELNITGTMTAGDYGIYMKNDVTGMSGSEFTGLYARAEAKTNTAAGKSLYGAKIWGVNNAVTQTTGSLWGQLCYAYVKGDAAQTIANVYGAQVEFSMDAGRGNNLTVTTEAAMLLLKATAGKMADDSKLHGLIIRIGDMDGDAAAFGNGILIQDDSVMSGVCTFATGVNINNAILGINIGTATTGIDFSGTFTNAMLCSNAVTNLVNFDAAATDKAIEAATANMDGTTSHIIRVSIGATPYYIPVFTAKTL